MSNRIPKADAVNALGVSDGTEARGTIVEHGGSHFAFGVTGDLVGKFETQLAAMRALPPSKTVTRRRRTARKDLKCGSNCCATKRVSTASVRSGRSGRSGRSPIMMHR